MQDFPRNFHLVGIGGAGMAPLGAILLESGCRVTGSDREANEKTAALAAAGAAIAVGHAADQLPPDAEMLLYSSAIPADNPERAAAAAAGIPQLRRGEFLALLARRYRRTVAVSGSHGKTSITALLVHILLAAGRRPGYLIGGSVPGLAPGRAGDGDIFVTEADESDGSHTAIAAAVGIIPNLDDDHAWSVGGEAQLRENFRTFARQAERLICYAPGIPPGAFDDHPNALMLDAAAIDAPGLDFLSGFQRRNAALSLAAAASLGVDRAAAIAALRTFPGVKRRFTLHCDTPELVIIEDYAHHPVELENAIDLLKSRYPDRHLRAVFQPHRHARLQKYLDRFAAQLRRADSCLITPVFAAWSESSPISGADLAVAIGPAARYLDTPWPQIAAAALAPPRPILLAILGAGDLDQILPHLTRA